MKPLQLHIIGLTKTFKDLGKGNYLIYFIPGIVVAILFWQVFLVLGTVENSVSFLDNIPLLGTFLGWILGGTFGLLKIIFTQLFVFFVLTLLSPFNTLLSEKVAFDLTGVKIKFDLERLISDLIRMIFIVLIAVILQLFFFFIYFIVSSILGLGFLDEAVYFVISAFFYGFAFYDYSLERDQIGVFGSLRYAFSNILMVSLTGAFFLLLYTIGSFFVGSFTFSFLSIIPNLGIIAAPVLTTILATYVYILNKQETNDRTQK